MNAELDPSALLRATRRCLRKTRGLTKTPLRAIAGSGFWHSLLGLDRAGNPLTPVYTWADARGMPDAARLREQFDERRLEGAGSLGELRCCRGRGTAGRAALGVLGDPVDHSISCDQGDPNQVAARCATGGAGEGAVGNGTAVGAVLEMVLDRLSGHQARG